MRRQLVGGAEAIAVAGLEATGLWTEEESTSYAERPLKECAQLANSVEAYCGFYAYGFKRFRSYGTYVVPL